MKFFYQEQDVSKRTKGSALKEYFVFSAGKGK